MSGVAATAFLALLAAGPPGEDLFRDGRFGAALAAFERDGGPSIAYARLLAARGRDEAAREAAGRALRAAPDDVELLYRSVDLAASRAERVERLERVLARGDALPEELLVAARGSLDFYRALGDRAIWLDVARPARATFALAPIWDEGDGRILGYRVAASLGPEKGKRRSISLLLDTGSPGLFVIARQARRAGFAELSERTSFGGGGGARGTVVKRGFFERLTLGELAFAEVLATSRKVEIDPFGRYHGLLGLGAFSGYRVTLDLRAGELTVGPNEEPLADATPYWQLGGLVYVEGRIGGREALLLLDTGASSTLVNRSLAAEIPGAALGEERSIRGVGGAYEGTRRLEGVEIELGTLRGEGTAPVAVDLDARDAQAGFRVGGYVGLDVLAGARIVFDTGRRELTITAPPR